METVLNYSLFDEHEYGHRILTACNSGQYIYVTGLLNFFFIPQDLIDRIDSYFQRIAFQSNFLLASNINVTSFFR